MSSQEPVLSLAVQPEQKRAAIRLGFRLKRWAYHAEMATWARVFPLDSLARHLRIANRHQRLLRVAARSLLCPNLSRDAEIDRIFPPLRSGDSSYFDADPEPYWELLNKANDDEILAPGLEQARDVEGG